MAEISPGKERGGGMEEERLDPRVQEELDKLNDAMDDINKLELELDEARASFRQLLTDSTQKLNAIAKKCGNHIEKARPYYDARMRAKEAHVETQKAALRFERACSQQAAAKEMVFLAEQGFFKKGQPFDPAWQEMLNHATIKVNDAEVERVESEQEHKRTAKDFNEAELQVKILQKQLKKNINKSSEYFRIKAKFNQDMDEQKKRVGCLENSVALAKGMYAEALRSLEAISDEIHRKRAENNQREAMGVRGAGVGAEAPPPPRDHDPLTGCPIYDPEDTHKVVRPAHLDAESLSRQNSLKRKLSPSQCDSYKAQCQEDEVKEEAEIYDPLGVAKVVLRNPKKQQETDSPKSTSKDVIVHVTCEKPLVTVENLTPSPEGDLASMEANAEIMDTLQKAKSFGMRFLRPKSRDDLLEDSSETDSLTGSMASVSMLDDEQLESLMLETGEFVTFLEKQEQRSKEMMSKTEKRRSLPTHLVYLEEFIKFKTGEHGERCNHPLPQKSIDLDPDN